ncbi:DUF411 domain-containing protein [Neptuniibacter sp. SY11_33]|uniref:DUF411 domain-containing protein n=1 Tax=Neptuniibacter sp. SY11_33 TaxID=3398215 RepID=UPI0039F56872
MVDAIVKIKRVVALCLVTVALPAYSGDPYWLEGRINTQHEIDVYRSESCGCCKTWITHLKEHNFVVRDHVLADVTPLKEELGVPKQGYSCHTAKINGKVIEGHVPAQAIKKALSNEDIKLLTVPGMVSGSPGMDMPGAPKHAFKVYSVDSEGEVGVFSEYANY